jgi:ribonuclease P protein component
VVVHLTVPPVTEIDRTQNPVRAIAVRAGFVVPRSVGGAVVRNAVRRRLRHLVAERLDRLPAAATLVVRALPPAADRTYPQLGADLDAAIAAASSPRPARASRGHR